MVFADETLLETAFTHTSYANEHRLLKISHNERLEFLGDAVLQLIISEYLYTKYPKRPEGDLSKLRSMIVREESLAGFARDCQFDHFIKLGRGKIVESFGVSHDAACPQFYRFMKDDKSFVMLTDTGYVSDRMAGIIENADGYLIESNHDIEILRSGAYPWSLKQRILSDMGHLSNEDGAETMIRTLGNRTKRIYLGHLSKENNIKELAHMTMVNQLAQADMAVGHDFQVYDTSPDTATPLTSI